MKKFLPLITAGTVLVGVALTNAHADDAVAKTDNVNVRAQPTTTSEVVTRLKKGEPVFIVDEVTLKKPKKDDPSKWVRIAYPTNTPVWVSTQFIDAASKTVATKKLNLRAGPGENYSVVGWIGQGTPITSIREKEGWSEITTPTNAFAYVASDLLTRTAPVTTNAAPVETTNAATNAPETKAVVPPTDKTTTTVPTTATTTTTTADKTVANSVAQPAATKAVETVTSDKTTEAKAEEVQKPAPAPDKTAEAKKVEETKPETTTEKVEQKPAVTVPDTAATNVVATTVATNAPTDISTNAPTPVLTQKRIVAREGIVRPSFSPKAPTDYALENPDTGLMMDYLFSVNQYIKVKRYVGYRVIVTGQEGVDPHWPSTPVLQVETIEFP